MLRTENAGHPAAAGLPTTWTSSVSEWYSWSKNLRNNPAIRVLASVDPVSFPLGTDPNQSWYSGDHPIVWTNTSYRMLYANFGHNAMDYASNTRLSSTFASATQNRLLLDGLKWLGGVESGPAPQDPVSETAWYSLADGANGLCVDARAAGTANGTAVQQYACNDTVAQQFQFRATDTGHYRIGVRNSAQQVIDVTGVSTAVNAPLQLWSYAGGHNQQWRVAREASGLYRFTARHSGHCLSALAGAPGGTQLEQRACDGSSAQSFRLTQRP